MYRVGISGGLCPQLRGKIMLTEQQQAIKRYIKQFHDIGLKPTIRQIAAAFLITNAMAHTDVKAIKEHIKKDANPVKDIFDLWDTHKGIF